MGIIPMFVTAGSFILLFMTILWMISLILKNSSIVDIFWGAGFVFSNVVYFFLTPDGSPARKWLITAMLTLWGLRLSFYILSRNWRKPEDFRYQKWRQESGKNWWWFSFFKVFLLQGILMWIISAPLLSAHYSADPARLMLLDYLGILVFLIGFFFESVGDLQLARFKSDPANKGKLMDQGVWHFTRHPNYFGDSAQWWGFFLVSASAGGWWSIFSPILMTFLLVKVSGVALLEKSLDARPGFLEYTQTTSAFLPWFPKK
jgi:steroid 5-alpha reductase family enzyme